MTLDNEPPRPDDRALVLFLLVLFLILLGSLCGCTTSRTIADTHTRIDSLSYQEKDSCATSCATTFSNVSQYDTTYYRIVIYDTTRHDVHVPYMTIDYGHTSGRNETTVIRDTVRMYYHDTIVTSSSSETTQHTDHQVTKRLTAIERYMLLLTFIFAVSGFATLYIRYKRGFLS